MLGQGAGDGEPSLQIVAHFDQLATEQIIFGIRRQHRKRFERRYLRVKQGRDLARENDHIFVGNFSKKDIDKIDLLSLSSLMEITTRPRRCKPLIAISRFGASISPSLFLPSWSTALYLNSIPYEVKVYLLVLLKLNNNQNFSSHKNI